MTREETIEGLLASAAAGSGRSLIVTGGAGSGKTTLLNDAAARARAAGFRVLLARGGPGRHDVAPGVGHRLFGSALAALPAEESQALLHLLDAGGDARRTFHTVLRRLLRTSPAVPLLVVVDDLHWVDRESLEWLVTLPEHAVSLPVSFVASICDGMPETDPALVEEIRAFSPDRLALGRLGVDAVSALLPDDDLAATATRVTGGNPSLLASLRRRLADRTVEALDTVVLDTLAAELEARLRHVSPYAMGLLRATAVLDAESTLPRLAAMVGAGLPETADVVRRLSRLGFVAEERGRPRATPVLVRNAVLAGHTYEERQRIHARAARLLRDEPGAEPAVLRHLMASAPVGEAWVPRLLREAATSADPHTALLHLRRALDEPLTGDVRARVLFELASVAAGVDLPAAAGYLGQARSVPDGQDVLDVIDALIVAGHVDEARRWTTLGPPERREAVSRRLTLLPAHAALDPEVVRRTEAREPGSALTSALQAALIADRGSDRRAALSMAGRVVTMSVTGTEDLLARLLACRVLTVAGRPRAAVAQADAASLAARRRGQRFLVGLSLTARASALHATGDLRAAEAAMSEGVELLAACRVTEKSPLVAGLHVMLADLLVDLGRLEDAAGLVDRREAPEDRWPERLTSQWLYVRGRLKVRQGQPIGGVHDLIAAGQGFIAVGIANPAVADWRGEAARALHDLGEQGRARLLAADDFVAASRWGTAAAVGRSLRARAVVGPPEEARSLLERSVDLLRTGEERLLLAEAMADLGRHLVRTAKPEARKLLRRACALAEETGCADLRERSRDLLAASGGRPTRPARAGVAGLTRSERRVAELAAARNTNKAIAAQLFVGRRTVEIHLTNAYRKLGIAGRDQLRGALHPSGTAVS